ncbi:MAG: ATP-binding cassette domain-containing protein [Hylemonella sp.]|nr:ATP-binding cassette domain-containing protein [Hylemonella sp.]
MSSAPVVEVQKLWTVFHHGGRETVIHKELDLCVECGEMVSLVGGSGTGKTTLLRQILGLETPAQGHINVQGRPVTTLAERGAARRVGMLFQQGALFSAFSVLDNIAFPMRELKLLPDDLIRDIALVKLQMVGLDAKHAHKMPADLSGGMVKRAALARALVMDPPLLMLDEPTAGLDPASADSFCRLLKDLHHELGLTVVMVTHDLDSIYSLNTNVAVLADQKVVFKGSLHDVITFDHPFVHQFFLGERGQRAMAMLNPSPAAA